MNTPLVSIIMPVYNAEKFIEKTILSLNNQTYDNIEVIAINDGSKDDTKIVLDGLMQREDLHIKLRVVHQENMGICHTRNNGIQLAEGKYIAFVDHDDFMMPDAVERLVAQAENKNADMVIGGFELIDKDGKILEHRPLNPKDPWSMFHISAPWGRIFKRELIMEHDIKFFITKISEDFYFNYVYMSYCNKIEVIPEVTYQWLYSPTSESHANMSQYSKDRDVLLMLTALMNDMKKDHNLPKEYMEYGLIKHVLWYMFYVSKSTSKDTLSIIYKNCISWLDTNCPNYKRNSLVKFTKPISEGLVQRVFVKVMVTLEKLHLLKPFLYVYAGKILG